MGECVYWKQAVSQGLDLTEMPLVSSDYEKVSCIWVLNFKDDLNCPSFDLIVVMKISEPKPYG